jgi:hypothetical protein
VGKGKEGKEQVGADEDEELLPGPEIKWRGGRRTTRGRWGRRRAVLLLLCGRCRERKKKKGDGGLRRGTGLEAGRIELGWRWAAGERKKRPGERGLKERKRGVGPGKREGPGRGGEGFFSL